MINKLLLMLSNMSGSVHRRTQTKEKVSFRKAGLLLSNKLGVCFLNIFKMLVDRVLKGLVNAINISLVG